MFSSVFVFRLIKFVFFVATGSFWWIKIFKSLVFCRVDPSSPTHRAHLWSICMARVWMNQLANQSGRSANAFRDEQSLTRRVAGQLQRRARYSTSIAPVCQRADFDQASVTPSPAAAAADRVITTRDVLSVGRCLQAAERYLMRGRHEFIQ